MNSNSVCLEAAFGKCITVATGRGSRLCPICKQHDISANKGGSNLPSNGMAADHRDFQVT
eukprot:CAMPEP_0180440736 /NCGR_PEP_ID=MMETSP1036_2-20121128/13265_1 /TAXON_ID=632150 /ORGANISM="Azadinium spinosum, Strain 3D9" /LENGTH=59 /DNA_ID=CAMNT_0022446931 /DNA_START=882 /DNA_END=1061 /DNA_ORIENTATION=+